MASQTTQFIGCRMDSPKVKLPSGATFVKWQRPKFYYRKGRDRWWTVEEKPNGWHVCEYRGEGCPCGG